MVLGGWKVSYQGTARKEQGGDLESSLHYEQYVVLIEVSKGY
jgi:hypothetical protein